MKFQVAIVYLSMPVSLPSRERGLKFGTVTVSQLLQVAPLAGAWIEIMKILKMTKVLMSLPSRERGLKFQYPSLPLLIAYVAPLAGAWIEIFSGSAPHWVYHRRSPRGSVD